MKRLVRRFVHDHRAATAIEYGLIVSLIAVVITSMLSATGCTLNTKFQSIGNALR